MGRRQIVKELKAELDKLVEIVRDETKSRIITLIESMLNDTENTEVDDILNALIFDIRSLI